MLKKTSRFWVYSTREIITMPYAEIEEKITQEAAPLDKNEIVVELTKRKISATSTAEQLACSRIVSALLGGPDVIDY